MVDKPEKTAAERAASDKRNRTIDLPAKEVTKDSDGKKDMKPAEPVLAAERPSGIKTATPTQETSKPPNTPATGARTSHSTQAKPDSSKASGTKKQSDKPASDTRSSDNTTNEAKTAPSPNQTASSNQTQKGQETASRPQQDGRAKKQTSSGTPSLQSKDEITAAARPDHRRSTNPLTLILAAILGGVVALGGAFAVLQQGVLTLPTDAQLASEVDGLQKKVSALEDATNANGGDSLSNLTDRVASLENNVGSLNQGSSSTATGQSGDLEERVSALESASGSSAGQSTELAALKSDVSKLFETVQSLQSASAGANSSNAASGATASAISSLQTKLSNLEQSQSASVTDLKASVADIQARLSSAQSDANKQGDQLASLSSQVNALMARLDAAPDGSSLAELSAQVESLQAASIITNAATPVLISDSLLDAIQAGQPFSNELDAVSRLMPDDPSIAKLGPYAGSGLPSESVLKNRFETLRPALAKTNESPEDGPIQRLIAGAKGVIEVRSSEPIEGSDPFAIVSRIAAALETGNLTSAATEWQSLPADRKAQSEDWANQLSAMAAAQDLAARARQTALENLSATSTENGGGSLPADNTNSATPSPDNGTNTSSQ